jgi:hypothetical protein
MEPVTKNQNLPALKLIAGDLVMAGLPIDIANFSPAPGSAAEMLSRLKPHECLSRGDIGSTEHTFSRVLNLKESCSIGEDLAQHQVPAHMRIQRRILPKGEFTIAHAPLNTRDRDKNKEYADETNVTCLDVIPVFTLRDDNMSMLAITEATGTTRNWIHAMNFVLLREELLPAFSLLSSLIRLLVYDQMPAGITRQQVDELLIIRPDTLDLQGGSTSHLEKFKHHRRHPNLVIHFNCDPSNEDNHLIYKGLMQATTGSSRGTFASVNLMGFVGYFVKPLDGKDPRIVPASLIPAGLITQPLYLLLFDGLPDWCTPVHLSIIMQMALSLHIHCAFHALPSINAMHASTRTRQALCLAVSLPSATAAKQVLKSHLLINQVFAQLDAGDTSRLIEITTMPGTPIRPPTATTPELTFAPFSRITLNTMVQSEELYDEEELKAVEQAPDAMDTVLTKPLPSHRVQAAYDILRHQLQHDTTLESLQAVLTILNVALPRTDPVLTRLAEWFPQLAGLRSFPAMIRYWIKEHLPDFQLVDNKESHSDDDQDDMS